MKTKLFYLLILSCTFSFAQQQVPSFGSLQALNITHNSVRFQFNVRTNGSYTNCRVWWSVNSNLSAPVNQSNNIGVPQNINWQTQFVDIGGLLPNTTYYWRVTGSNSLGNSDSSIVSFTTSIVPNQPPTISNVSQIPSVVTCNVTYQLNANGTNSASLIRYGLNQNNLDLSMAGINATGTTNTPANVELTGLAENTTYFYKVEATNLNGTVQSDLKTFTTYAAGSLYPIINYPFNGSYADINGNSPFSTANTSFVLDRNNNIDSAVRISSTSAPSTATIANLITGNNNRTLSLWCKVTPFTVGAAGIFAYGSNASLQTFGFYIAQNGNQYFQGFGTDHNFSGNFGTNSWKHIVLTYDGTAVRYYANGVLVGSQNYILNTGNTTGFRLGGNGAVIDIDDLQVYNFVLNQSQITSLFQNNNLSNESAELLNESTVIYPNPTADIFTIKSGSPLEKVEVYNLSGQLVFESKLTENNISGLPTGLYMVKITDENQKSTTQKLIKK